MNAKKPNNKPKTPATRIAPKPPSKALASPAKAKFPVVKPKSRKSAETNHRNAAPSQSPKPHIRSSAPTPNNPASSPS